MLEISVLTIASLLNILIGLVVYIKNPKSITNQAFFFLTISFVLWSIVNFISVHPTVFSQLVWIRLVLFCAAVLNFAVFLTFLAFPSHTLSESYKKKAKLALYLTLVVLPLTLTPLVFKEVQVTGGVVRPVPNPGIALFLLQTFILIGSSFGVLIKKYRNTHGKTRTQLRFVLLGIISTFSLIIVTNFLLVLLFNITALVPYGPLFTLIFSGTMAYAIVKHKLFDIKLVIARALGYVLSLGMVIALYSLFVVGVGRQIFDDYPTLRDKIIQPLAIILLGLSYPSFKKFFDKVTNKIFYRDAYDPQIFLDELNQVLVANIELRELLGQSARVMETNLKTRFMLASIESQKNASLRVIGSEGMSIKDSDLHFIAAELAKRRHNTIVTDDLNERDSHLKRILDASNIGVIVRLQTGSEDTFDKPIAHLILGSKRSGNSYNKQDMTIIEIISDELIIAIQNALRFEEIENFNITLQSRIDDATLKLQKTNERLKELDETKDEFISMASHQLRTPLTSVKGYLSMVIDGDAGKLNDMQKELLGQAFASSQRMVYLIADLLNVSRLKTGKFIIDASPTNLADIIEAEIGQLKEVAKLKQLTLTYHKPADFPVLMLDETKIRQVIMNFIDNAIYYTPPEGTIHIELKSDKSNIYCIVKDNGLGVPKEEQAHLFTKFYRASNAQKARPDGTGLGLFMAKKVVNAQGGTILFESTENQGSTFGFVFEKAKLIPKPPTHPTK